MARTHAELPYLKQAQAARRSKLLLTVASAALGSIGLLGLFVTATVLAIATPGLLVTGVALAFAALPLLFAVLTLKKGLSKIRELNDSLDAAYASVAAELLRAQPNDLSSSELAQYMRLTEQDADRILARLNVQDTVRSRVTDAGEIVYSAREPLRLRVGEGAEPEEFEPHEDIGRAKTLLARPPRK